MGFPNWLDNDSTMQITVILLASILIVGIGLSIYIRRWRRKAERRALREAQGMHHYGKNTKKKIKLSVRLFHSFRS